MATFGIGDEVEVCIKEGGLEVCYYRGMVLAPLNAEKLYKIQYDNLLTEDERGQLVEMVSVDDLWPLHPKRRPPMFLSPGEKVEAFNKGGWWVGKIVRRKGYKYLVYFGSTQEVIEYPVTKLTRHTHWHVDSS